MTAPALTRISTDGDRRKRQRQVLVRLSDDELADLERLALAHGLTLPQVLRAGLTILTASEGPR